MATYILVSGAWHAGWCWERVVPLLEVLGHRVIAPDLVGMGADRSQISTVSLTTWVDQIASIIRDQEEPVILVGHSRGGIVISEVAERVPDLITTLVYLTAFLVPSGKTLMSTSAKVVREREVDILIPQDDGTTIVRPDSVGSAFYNTTEPSWIQRAENSVSPEPMVVFATPLNLTEKRFGSVERAYIECVQDNAVPLELQRIMQESLPCAPVFTLDTDHSPFYSAPDQLVACLHEIALGNS